MRENTAAAFLQLDFDGIVVWRSRETRKQGDGGGLFLILDASWPTGPGVIVQFAKSYHST